MNSCLHNILLLILKAYKTPNLMPLLEITYVFTEKIDQEGNLLLSACTKTWLAIVKLFTKI